VVLASKIADLTLTYLYARRMTSRQAI
jgi:hypothetical protein